MNEHDKRYELLYVIREFLITYTNTDIHKFADFNKPPAEHCVLGGNVLKLMFLNTLDCCLYNVYIIGSDGR